MDTNSLYDLTPIAWLMAAGVLIALGFSTFTHA